MSRGRSFIEMLSKRRQRLYSVLIGVAVLIAGVYAFDYWSNHRLNENWQNFYRINKTEGDTKWKEMEAYFEGAPKVRPAYFAAVSLGEHYFNEAKRAMYWVAPTEKTDAKADPKTEKTAADTKAEEDKAEAKPPELTTAEAAERSVSWYTKALEFGELLPAERQLIYINRGNGYELAGQIEKANVDYQTAVDYGGGPKGLAMLNLARGKNLLGDKEGAKTIYQTIVKELQDTEYAKLAKNHLRRLESPLFSKPNVQAKGSR